MTHSYSPLLGLVLFINGCAGFIPLEESSPNRFQKPPTVRLLKIPGPDPGAGIPLRTLHFVVEGYGPIPRVKSDVVEKIYTVVMNQTALYSFKPKENYRVVIYQNFDEFRRKTGQPEWSGGMKLGLEVFTYEHEGIDVVLAHEITHIIFGEFLKEKEKDYRWLNEGLAMYIDSHFNPQVTVDQNKSSWVADISKQPLLTVKEITEFQPYSHRPDSVRVWYSTVASLTGFLIENGGPFNFSLFLKGIKSGEPMDVSFQSAYPGKYRSVQELYDLWKATYRL